jgi:type II secretory pathway component PulF
MNKKNVRKSNSVEKRYRRNFWRIIFIGSDDVEGFLENLSLMLSVNVALGKILKSIAGEVNNKTFKKVVLEVAEGVNAGMSLSEAMKKTRAFREYTIELIESGERSGNLLHNLELIVEQRVKERSVKGKIISAMVYPIFVLMIGALAGIAIFGFVLPRVTRVFDQLNIDLPWITEQIIAVGRFLDANGVVVIPVAMVVIVLGLFFMFIFKPTKFIGQFFLLRLPVMGRLIKEIELARLGFNLGTLLKAGIPVDRAIGSLTNLTDVRDYQKFYIFMASQIENGNSFLETFNMYKNIGRLIPSPVQQIIEAGEQSASLSLSFDRIGEIFERKTENTTKALITLLEPLLLFTVWIGVAGIAMAIIIPIYSLIGNFGERDYATAGEQEITSEVPEDLNAAAPEEDTEEQEVIEPVRQPVAEYRLLVDPSLSINLNVRSGRSTAKNIVAELEPGSIVDGINLQDGWYEVLLPDGGGETGWAYGVYLTEQNE